jgi:hypothetical protein
LSAVPPRPVRPRATPAADTDLMHNRQPGKWIVAARGLLLVLGWNLF